MIKCILVALDGSATSNAGLKAALELARGCRSGLTALHVIDDRGIRINLHEERLPAEYFRELHAAMRKHGRGVLKRAQAVAQRANVPLTVLLTDSNGKTVAQAILDQARKVKADIIVMGTHGRRGIARAIMSSDAEAVLHETSVPMLLIRGRRYSRRSSVPLSNAALPLKIGRSRSYDTTRPRDRPTD